MISRAKWKVEYTSQGALAVYKGRAGVAAAASILSERSSNEEANAAGSSVAFETEEATEGITVCTMWLSSASTTFGFTNDARFMRPYMQRVQRGLANLDSGLQVETT
jgi:hypothetical protein